MTETTTHCDPTVVPPFLLLRPNRDHQLKPSSNPPLSNLQCNDNNF
jgi:hypothetical protein